MSVHLSPLVVFLVHNVKSNPLIEYSHTTRLTTHLNCDTHLARATIFNTRTSSIFVRRDLCDTTLFLTLKKCYTPETSVFIKHLTLFHGISSYQLSFKYFVFKTMFTTLFNTFDVKRSGTWTLVMICPCHRFK